jgi:hypothetical protein
VRRRFNIHGDGRNRAGTALPEKNGYLSSPEFFFILRYRVDLLMPRASAVLDRL